MGINSFWLFYIESNSILASLINWGNGRYYVASIGPRVNFDFNDQQSALKAADESLSSAATSADLSPEEEPSSVGLVIPSSWVGDDGKIIKNQSDFILPILKSLDLKPSGFMTNDEAIIEEAKKPDDFPASFIILYLEETAFEVSLIYLGKIKKRARKKIDTEFTPQMLEDCLVEFNSNSALPPQIYIYGKADESTIENLKNFPWIGKKSIETFLHFPDIKLYQDSDLVNIFFKAITSQIISGSNLSSHQPVSAVELEDDQPEEEEVSSVDQEVESESDETADEIIEETDDFERLEEVPFGEFGFGQNQKTTISPPISSTENISLPIIENIEEIIPPPPKKQFSFNFPKLNFKLPKFKKNTPFFILILIAFFVSIPTIFSKANITVFVTPYEFDKTVNVTLDSNTTDISQSTIPVEKKSNTVNASTTIKTTGKKTVGEKATGEITIFNKLEKSQNIPKGAILIDSQNHEFELMNPIQVAASNTNYDTGTMDFGQVKTAITASDIGSEYNINKSTSLAFKDYPETSIVVKTNGDFTGGSKKDINAVSDQDKINAVSQLNESIKKAAEEKINQEFNNTNNIIKGTIQTKKSQVDLNREVGEETDDLTATAQADITVFILNQDVKDKIIKQFLSGEVGFSDSDLNSNSLAFNFTVNKLNSDSATGSLNIKGSSLPKIDTNNIKKSIIGRTIKSAQNIIKKNISRAYDFNFKVSLSPFKILPLNSKNILVNIKTESL